MSSNQIVNRDDLAAYIAAGGTATDALMRLLVAEDEQVAVEKKRSTIATRKEAFAKAIAELDDTVLADIESRMETFVTNIVRIKMDEPRPLKPTEAADLMAEYIDFQKVSEFLATRRDTIKALVFASIDAENREKGLDPTITGGSIEVESLGKKFCKEGAGYRAPGLDENALRLALGPEDAARVFHTEIIPAKEIQVLSEEALMQLAQEKPEIMETIRAALVPGAVKAAKFQVRDYTPGK